MLRANQRPTHLHTMVSPSNLLSLALLYICILFGVAWYADRVSQAARAQGDSGQFIRLFGIGFRATRVRGLIYALSLAVYCSSWTFYGAVGSATASAWSHAPIYLGPILLFVFGWPLIRRLLAVGERHRVTSIADYIGARYGKRQPLAVLVTLVATAAVLPYIALQFKALAQAWTTVGGTAQEVEAIGGDTALLVAIILAVFTILFGTRRLDGRERHQGMMTAVAVESVVKLLAFIAVAVLALSYLSDLPTGRLVEHGSNALGEVSLSADFFARTLLSALAILCLPRQFHAMVVEAREDTDTGMSRWIFPLYLGLFMLLVLPISIAGAQLLGGTVNPDVYVQVLPISLEAKWVTVAAFIGGISAATGMVIVATVSLAIMITNEVVAPIVMRLNADSPAAVLKLGDSLRRIRQFTIAGILLASWLVTRQIMGIPWLAQIGFISFLAAAQLAPALLAGLYWRRAHGVGVIVGLLAGLSVWFYCSVIPAHSAGRERPVARGTAGYRLAGPCKPVRYRQRTPPRLCHLLEPGSERAGTGGTIPCTTTVTGGHTPGTPVHRHVCQRIRAGAHRLPAEPHPGKPIAGPVAAIHGAGGTAADVAPVRADLPAAVAAGGSGAGIRGKPGRSRSGADYRGDVGP